MRTPGGKLPLVMAGLEQLEADTLAELARDKSVLEVGSAFGYSTIVMAQTATSVLAVDPMTMFDSCQGFKINVEAHGVAAKVSLLCEPAAVALPRLFWAGERFGLIFIDGDHMPASVEHDLTWARRLVTLGGTIALHDYLLGPGTFVRPECQKWREPDYLIETLAIYQGVEPAVDERAP